MNEAMPQTEAAREFEWQQTPELTEWLTTRDAVTTSERLAHPVLGPEDASDALDRTFIAALEAQLAAQSHPDDEELQEQARIMARVAVHHGSKLKHVFDKHDSKKKYISPAQHKVNQIIMTLDSVENNTALRDAVIAYYHAGFKPAAEQAKVSRLDILKRTATDNPAVRHGIAAAAVIGGISAAGIASAAPAAAAEPLISRVYLDRANAPVDSLDDVVTIVTNPTHQPVVEKVQASVVDDAPVNILPTPVEKVAATPEVLTKPADKDAVVTIPPEVIKQPEAVVVQPPAPGEAAPAPNAAPQPTTPEAPSASPEQSAANDFIQAARDMAKRTDLTPYKTSWQNTSIVMEYLLSHGFEPHQAVGVVANMMWESSGVVFDKHQGQGAAYGVVQWDGGRRDKLFAEAARLNVPVSDPTFQMDFFMQELHNFPYLGLAQLKATTNSVDATKSFERTFERAGVPHIDKRLEYAELIRTNFNQAYTAIQKAKEPAPAPVELPAGWPTNANDAKEMFNQCDPSWGNILSPHGVRTCNIACGPTSTAWVIDDLKPEVAITPKDTIEYANNHALWLSSAQGPDSGGTSFDGVITMAENWGLKGEQMQNGDLHNIEAYKKIFEKGGRIIAAGSGPSPFVKAPLAHFVVIRGMTADGRFLINDPYPKPDAPDTNKTPWDANQIMDSIFGAVVVTK